MASGSSSSSVMSSPVSGNGRCTVCLLELSPSSGRTMVTLRCSHTFHLDCIGSAFNSRRTMECPNCRDIEPGQWRSPERSLSYRERLREIAEELHGHASQVVPEYQWCPTHGWGWSIHGIEFAEANETVERMIVAVDDDDSQEPAQQDSPHQTLQQQNSSVGSSAAANQIPDLNNARETVTLQVNHAGSVNTESTRQASYGAGNQVPESSTPDGTAVLCPLRGTDDFDTPSSSYARNNRAQLWRARNDGALQAYHSGRGTGNASSSASLLDSVPHGALEDLGRPVSRTTHVMALPLRGPTSLFSIRRTLDSRGLIQEHAVPFDDDVVNTEATSPFEPDTP